MSVMWHFSKRIIDPSIDQFLEWLDQLDNDAFDHIHYESPVGHLLIVGPNMNRYMLHLGWKEGGGTLTDPRFKGIEVYIGIGSTPDNELIHHTVPKQQVIEVATSLIVNQTLPTGFSWALWNKWSVDEVIRPNLERAFARLSRIDKEHTTNQHQWSNMLLMREYLRRAALWASHLKTQPEWPFFDIAFYIDPDIRAAAELVEQARAMSAEPLEGNVYEWYLHWAAAQSSVQAIEPRLPDPYDPLIRIYERSAVDVEIEGAFIGISSLSIRIPLFENCLNENIIVDPHSPLLDELDDPEVWLARRTPGQWTTI